MSKMVTVLFSITCFFLATTAVEAASLSGKWTTPKGAVVQCSSTECTIMKGREEGEGMGVGAVILKDFSVKDGKGTAQMRVRRDRWIEVSVEAGDKNMTIKAGKDDRSRAVVWTRTE